MSDKLPPTEDERCGTNAGYQAHRRRVEVPCDSCRRARAGHDRAYRGANREVANARSRAYYDANRKAINARRREYREANREALTEGARKYYDANRGSIAEKNRAYNQANREAIAEQHRAYLEANREAIAEQRRAYREANSEGISHRHSAWQANISQAFADVAAHGGQAWTAEDDAIIRTTYDQPIVMVAAQLRRTPWAVNNRRAALRKLDRNQRKATA